MNPVKLFAAIVLSLTIALPAAASQQSVSIPAAFRLEGDAVQGGLMIGYAPWSDRVTLDDRPIPISGGYFLLGFERDAGPSSTLAVHRKRMRPEDVLQAPLIFALRIKKREYDIQRIDGLPRRKVTPDPEDLIRIRAEGRLMQDARSGRTLRLGFLSGFIWPARGLISGVYGSQRILNGEPRRPHFGVDIAAPTGTPVIAPADGQVTLVHPDMFFNGKSIVIDHGLGLTTVYIHLSDASVQPGQSVKQGDVIGKIGETGRATGPHLHWGARVRNVEIDPALLVEGKPQPLNGP